MTAVTVVVVEAEAEAVAISAVVVGGLGSGANGSVICASEGTEESAAKESVCPQRGSANGREEKEGRKDTPDSSKSQQDSYGGTEVSKKRSSKMICTHPLPEGLLKSNMWQHMKE